MAGYYTRLEQSRFPDSRLMIVDFKAISDAAWEGYAKGYAAQRAIVDNAKNDAMFLRSMMQGNPMGQITPGHKSILDTPSVTHDPLKTPGFEESMARQGFGRMSDTSYVGPKMTVEERPMQVIEFPQPVAFGE